MTRGPPPWRRTADLTACPKEPTVSRLSDRRGVVTPESEARRTAQALHAPPTLAAHTRPVLSEKSRGRDLYPPFRGRNSGLRAKGVETRVGERGLSDQSHSLSPGTIAIPALTHQAGPAVKWGGGGVGTLFLMDGHSLLRRRMGFRGDPDP